MKETSTSETKQDSLVAQSQQQVIVELNQMLVASTNKVSELTNELSLKAQLLEQQER